MKEILHSQDAMLSPLARSTAVTKKTADISKAYRQQQERYAKTWCSRHAIHSMTVSYKALVTCPNEVLPEIAAFLGGITEKVPAMRACINPDLRRTRKNLRRINRNT